MSTAALRDSWIDFLSGYRWDWFTSQTFRLPTHPEAADKVFRVWISMLNRDLFGPRWHKKRQSVYWVRALEWQKRNVLHFHALIAHPTDDLNKYARRLIWMDKWHELAGYARIEKPNSAEAVTRYVTKYLIKDGDLECSPFLRSLTVGTQKLLLSKESNFTVDHSQRSLSTLEHLAVYAAENRKQDLEQAAKLFS